MSRTITTAGRLPADPVGFVADAERITNERDVNAAVEVYAADVVVELITDGVRERYTGLEHATAGWRALMAAMDRRKLWVRKTLLAASDGMIVNEWVGSHHGSDDARGLDIWHFDAKGRVREHRLYTFLSVRHSADPVARLRMTLTAPVTGLAVLREQRRIGVTPGR